MRRQCSYLDKVSDVVSMKVFGRRVMRRQCTYLDQVAGEASMQVSGNKPVRHQCRYLEIRWRGFNAGI